MIKKKQQNNQIEILAPAGSYESFLAAIHAGADAVYAGGPHFGARAFADNFTVDKLKEAIDYAHLHGRKLYLTVNTLLKNPEIDTLHDYLEPLYLHGLDAVIVQDIGVLNLVRRDFPDMDIHASTQMSVANAKGALFLKAQGVQRVVPARELSLDEIRELSHQTGMEVECFVHGALCYCYSGQCLLSSLIGGRSGNRGQCAQPCRLPYQVNHSNKKEYVLSSKDICTLDYIPEMLEAGIDSFKIEGRMKRPEYVAAVTSIYRKYTDLYLENGKESYQVDPEDKMALMDLYNRGGFSGGYYKERNGRNMIAISRPNHAGVPAVRVLSQKGREISVQALTEIHKGDLLELTEQRENYTFGKDIPKDGKTVLIVPKGEYYKKDMVLNRIRNQNLLTEMDERFLSGKTQEKIYGYLRIAVGEPAMLTVCLGESSVSVFTEQDVQKAQTWPMDELRIRKQLLKTGNTEFTFETLEIDLDGDVFLPMQQLNELRRSALERLQEEVCSRFRRGKRTEWERKETELTIEKEDKERIPYLSVLVETTEQFETALHYSEIRRIYLDSNIRFPLFQDEHIRKLCDTASKQGYELFLAMPHIFREDAVKQFEQFYDRFLSLARDGVLIRNYESYEFLIQHGFDRKVILDHNLYVFNQYGKNFWKENGISSFTAPMELNGNELQNLGIEEAELVIYGRIPVMVSAQCIVKTEQRCTKRPVCTDLTDRRQKTFPVKNHCGFCYNVVYNSSPLSLFAQREEWCRMNPAGIRLQFTTENSKETSVVIEAGSRVRRENTELVMGDTEFTRGHFKRGIT